MLHIQFICLFLHNKNICLVPNKNHVSRKLSYVDVLIGYYNDDEDEEDGGYNDDGID